MAGLFDSWLVCLLGDWVAGLFFFCGLVWVVRWLDGLISWLVDSGCLVNIYEEDPFFQLFGVRLRLINDLQIMLSIMARWWEPFLLFN